MPKKLNKETVVMFFFLKNLGQNNTHFHSTQKVVELNNLPWYHTDYHFLNKTKCCLTFPGILLKGMLKIYNRNLLWLGVLYLYRNQRIQLYLYRNQRKSPNEHLLKNDNTVTSKATWGFCDNLNKCSFESEHFCKPSPISSKPQLAATL